MIWGDSHPTKEIFLQRSLSGPLMNPSQVNFARAQGWELPAFVQVLHIFCGKTLSSGVSENIIAFWILSSNTGYHVSGILILRRIDSHDEKYSWQFW